MHLLWRRRDQWLGTVGFLLVLCCFALPFVGWSAMLPTTAKAAYRGADLVVGAAVEVTVVSHGGEQTIGEPSDPRRIPRKLPALTDLQPSAVAALVLVVLGVALAALPRRRIQAVAAATAASAAACLITVIVLASGDIVFAAWNVPRPYLGRAKAVSLDIPIGAVLAVILLTALAVWNLGYVVRSLRPSKPVAKSAALMVFD